MAGAWASNRGTVLPALANLMNPVEPDQRYPQRHQQENRALPFTSQPHSHSSFPNNNGSSNNNANYIPSISSFSSASGENPTVITSRQPPALAGPPISWQLAPLSALTSTLPPPNGRFAPYSHYQTSRSDPKIYGSSRNFPSGSYSSLDQSFPRDSFSGGHGQEGHNNHTLPPLRNSNGWKDPIPLPSSSSIASSSTKSNSTSPQPTNWDDQATPRGSSDCVHGRSYVPKMDAFPTDEKEQDRLDLSHKIYLLLMKGALHWAPIGSNTKKILDIGTGTGIWSIEMAERYPNATIVGIDVLNLHPEVRANSELPFNFRIPKNVIFQMLDAETTWPWIEKFDYIHTRGISGCIENWPRLYEQAFHNLRPGGYIELQEYGTQVFSPDPGVDPLRDGSVIAKWSAWYNEASIISGRPPGCIVTENIRNELSAAGFVDIHQEVLMLPLGLWHPRREMKELGGYGLLNMLDGAEGFTLKLFTKYLAWPEAKCQQIVRDVQAEFKKGVRLYTRQFVVWGRKPLVGETVGPRTVEPPPVVKVPYPANGQSYFQ